MAERNQQIYDERWAWGLVDTAVKNNRHLLETRGHFGCYETRMGSQRMRRKVIALRKLKEIGWER